MTTLQKSLRMFAAVLIWLAIMALFVGGAPLLERLGVFGEAVATAWNIGIALTMTVGLLGVFWYIARVFKPPAYRQARTHGIGTTAQVLDIQSTGARMPHSTTITITRTRQAREYRLRVLVNRPDGAPYEATVVGIIEFAKVPKPGDTVAVKVHPQRPAVVVLAEEATP